MKETLKKLLYVLLFVLGFNAIATLFMPDKAFVVYWVFFAILLIATVICLLALLITGIVALAKNNHKTGMQKLLKGELLWSVGLIALLIIQIVISQVFAHTPATATLATLEQIKINGTTQSVSIRGESEDNPVILFLAGGPGGSQIQATREKLSALEKDFTIVNWEQPGVGKSYNAHPIKSLTPDVYVEDAHALTQYLKDRFNQEKIYLIGESWGSYLGIRLSKEFPEDYHAFIGTGQMVDFSETEQYCYDLALSLAKDNNDQQQIKALENLDEIPIRGKNISLEIGTYLMYLHKMMGRDSNIKHTDWNTFKIIFSAEYSILDTMNYFRGLYYTFSHVYQQLYGKDLRQTHTEFEIPIYILHGRHDFNAPTYLAEVYYEKITAPDKQLVWFEHSGHNPWINESELFQEKAKELFGD
ncbi:MAG: alpha/beta fold hydrolase [Thermotogota bacterium]